MASTHWWDSHPYNGQYLPGAYLFLLARRESLALVMLYHQLEPCAALLRFHSVCRLFRRVYYPGKVRYDAPRSRLQSKSSNWMSEAMLHQ